MSHRNALNHGVGTFSKKKGGREGSRPRNLRYRHFAVGVSAAVVMGVLSVSVMARAQDRAAPLKTQTAAVGAVGVSATPLNLTESGTPTIDFQLMMDSHSGSLPSDMRAFARLVWEGGAETRPSAWAWSTEKEGHHRSVRLSFPSAGLEAGGVFTLVLGSDDVRNGRRFEWRLPSKAANTLTGGA